jgi:hypothetical protein
MSNKKLGLYAQYSKIDGSLINSKVMLNHQAETSSNDSSRMYWDLITDNPDEIYVFDKNKIPKTSANYNDEMAFESSDEYINCDICCENIHFSEFDQLEDEENPSLCNVCKNCS